MKTPFRAAVLLGALLAAWALAAPDARASGYATDDSGVLYRVFPSRKKAERIGVVQVPGAEGSAPETPSLTDIALHDEHGLYGISYTHLYAINLEDPAKSRRVGALGPGFFSTLNALAFDEDGNLFLAGRSTLYRVDRKTAKATPIGSFGTSWTSDGDLAWVEGKLYGTVNGPAGCLLVTLDVETGKATAVGAIRTDDKTTLAHVWGLIWDGRILWGLTPAGEILQLDRKTAIAKPQAAHRVTFWGACAMLRI